MFISMMANAGNFSVLTEHDGSKIIVCEMDNLSKVKAFHAMGLQFGDSYPARPILKNAFPGTKILVDDSEVASASPALAINGYQLFYLPQDEYIMTMLRPDGSKLKFPILIYHGTPCVLDHDELMTALAK